ncbi:MAG: sigma-70 family RNA polymerase sigma factor [Bacillota bacterium]|nr:sigma-70 family RNA polymerase sigma factor [Bacillota bacterium]
MQKGYSQQEMEDFFTSEYPQLYRYAVYLTRDQETAQDLCQETFIRWFGKKDKTQVENPQAWLKKVLSNLAMNYFRHQKVCRKIEDFSLDDEEGSTTMDQDLLRIEVEEVLAGLPWRDQMLLKMKMAGLSYAEMAEAMDVSIGSVGTMLARAMKRFKSLYEGKEVQTYEMSGRRHAFHVS